MRKNLIFYSLAFALIFVVFLFFSRLYQEMILYSDLTNRTNTIASIYQNLSRQIRNAAILNPDLIKKGEASNASKIFVTDRQSIFQQLDLLTAAETDSTNIEISRQLNATARAEMEWIITSNVPDSIIHNKSPDHIASLIVIDSLIDSGIARTNILQLDHKDKLHKTVGSLRTWMILFIILSGILLMYAFVNLSRQKFKTRYKEKEIADYRYALDEAAIVAFTDQKGIINYVNDNFCRISKYSRSELIGQDHRIINSGFHPKEYIRNLWMTIANGKIWKGELKNKAKDGTIYWVDTTIIPFLNDAGKPYKYVAIRADITGRKEAEQEAINAFNQNVTTLNRISDGVVSVDNEWRYTFLNDAALTTHPQSKEETLGKVIWDVHPEMKGTVFWDKYHEAMETKKVVEVENYYAPMNIWFSVKVYPSADGVTIFYKNITESKEAEQQLFQSLKDIKDYQYALDESSIVAITDQKGIIKHVNENFCKISKYTREELIGQDHRIINSGFHSKEFIRDLWITIANGKIWKGELKNKAKDGTIYWVDTTIVPFLDQQGKPFQYIAIRADITDRKQVEENLAFSEMHFRSLIENSAEGIALTDEFSNNLYRSPAAKKMMGDLPKENTVNLAHPDDLELIKKKHAFVMKNPGIPIDFQGRFRHASGNYVWLEGILTNLLDTRGVNAIVTNFRNITQRKEAEEQLIKSEKIYKTIASSIPGSVICLLDNQYTYQLIEGDMLEKLGYSKDELLGKKAEDVLPSEIFDDVKKQFQMVLNGETVTRESINSGYDIISRFIPLKDENNAVYGIMTVAIDITQLKNAQRDIAQLNRNLEEKIIERTGQLKKSNEELEAFSYSVSHDLRAPLRGIIGFSTILEEDYGPKLDEEGTRLIAIIKMNTLKMGNLIDDLLDFSRMGKQGIMKTQINTQKIVGEIIRELTPQGKELTAINWQLAVLPPVLADMSMIRQVWINLISNAIKYSSNSEFPRIEIGSYPEQDHTVFYIKDNGVGFDEEYKDKLFKVFQRLHGADEFEGTGVGLALVEKIISRHDGRVWAEGKEDVGASFYFSLPSAE